MPGPNSSPNGDSGLIVGHEDERFVYCDTCKKVVSERRDREKHRTLRTGKTK